MKNLFKTIFIFNTFAIFGQMNNMLLVEYKIVRNEIVNKEILICNQNNAVYTTDSLLVINKDVSTLNSVNGGKIEFKVKQKKIRIDKTTYYLSKNKNTIFITRKSHLVKDSLPKIDWKLEYTETKLIGNFICNKATTKFRGSNLIAWYSLQLPYSFGPWKLKGLPGVILELQLDDYSTIEHWTAQKIIVSYKGRFNLEYDKSLPILRYEDEVKKREKDIENQSNVMDSRLPPGVKLTSSSIERIGVEKIYEWEK